MRYDLAPPLVQGTGTTAEDATGQGEWLATFAVPGEISYREPVTTVGADGAFRYTSTSMSGTRLGDSDAFTLWFRSTFGLRRIDGHWRIDHEHESTPFYMDGSFTAAVNLEP